MLRCAHPLQMICPPQCERMWFDAAHQHFLVLELRTFYIWRPDEDQSLPLPFYHEPTLPASVILAKISLDSQLIVVQVSSVRVMVFDTTNLSKWTIDIKSSSENRIHPDGLIWSEHGGNSQDLIIVTLKGLEMYKISSLRNQCKLSRTISQGSHPHTCFWYEPNHRMMLLASPAKGIDMSLIIPRATEPGATSSSSRGSSATIPPISHYVSLSAEQKAVLLRNNTLILNGFYFRSEKSDLPKLELPPPDKTPKFELGPRVAQGDVVLATLYGVLFCIVHISADPSDRSSHDVLELFSMTKTAVVKTHSLSMHVSCPSVQVSTYDSLLFVHCMSIKVSLIFDIHNKSNKSVNSISRVDPICMGGSFLVEDDVVQPRQRLSSYSAPATLAPHTGSGSKPETHASLPNAPPSQPGTRPRASDALLPPPSPLSSSAPVPARPLAAQASPPRGQYQGSSGSAAGTGAVTGVKLVGRASESDESVGWGDAVGMGSDAVIAVDRRLSADFGTQKQGQGHHDSSIAADGAPIEGDRDGASTGAGGAETLPESSSQTSSPVAGEAIYSSEWDLLPPSWVWDSEKHRIWRLKSCLANIASSIHNPRLGISFLARRGQVFRAPHSVYYAAFDSADGPEAKQLMLRKVSSALEGRVGLSWLEVLFKAITVPYANEALRIKVAISDSYAMSSEGQRRAFQQQLQQQQQQQQQEQASLRTNVDSPRTFDPTEGPIATSMLYLNSLLSNAQQTLTAGYYLALGIGTKFDTEPLESPMSLHLLLPDIAAVGSRSRPIATGGRARTGSAGTLGVGVHSNTHSAAPLLSSSVPLVTRRDEEGYLVLSQTEIISHVWLPIILNGSIDPDYCAWALTSYVAVLRGGGVDIHPALSMLVLRLLASHRKYMDIARFLQLQFLPDAMEVAMTALELCDVIAETAAETAPSNGDNECTQQASNGAIDSSLCNRSSCIGGALWLQSAVATLQQVGLDMLWRLQERATVIRWLLGHGKVIEAINLCKKHRGQWRAGLSPASIPGTDFFVAALIALQEKKFEVNDTAEDADSEWGYSDEEADEFPHGDDGEAAKELSAPPPAWSYVLSPGDRVEMLHTVYKFIQEWDHAVLQKQHVSESLRL